MMQDLDRSSWLARLRVVLGSLGMGRGDVVALGALALAALAGLGALWWAQRTPGTAAQPETLEVVGADSSEPVVETGITDAGDPQPGVASDPISRVDPARDEAVAGTSPMVVHVAGLVAHPGVQRLPAGARVADAVEAAGGALPEAWLDALNLARPLSDGEQVLVPPRPGPGEPQVPSAPASGPGAPGGATGGGVRPDGTLDLNRASAQELEELPGIGPVMAARIVEHREVNGPYTSVGQLREVRGIGEKTFQELAPLVSV